MNFHWILCSTAKSARRYFPLINNFRSTTSAPTNEPPLSEMIASGHPWWDANRRIACRKVSADADSTISKWTAMEVVHVKIAPHVLLDLFLSYFRRKGPKRSTPVTVNGGHISLLDLVVDFPLALNVVVDVLSHISHNFLLGPWQAVCHQESNTSLSIHTVYVGASHDEGRDEVVLWKKDWVNLLVG